MPTGWEWRVRCPNCSSDNPDGQKFCGECAAPLARTCPNCGAPVGPAQKFCGECATPLTGSAAPPPAPVPAAAPPRSTERRVVSVLFADLVGFTPLSETRDAESVRELLSGYFDVARTVIDRYGGTVEKFIGDAVMAVWGVPTAMEDDAERCVRAAIDLVDAVADYGQTAGASGLTARAGVVTGEVAVTLGAAGQGMVAGDAVNTAARVQAAAEPGTVLVDETTRQTTARAIGFADVGEHTLKGKAEPVRLWRATRVVAAIGGSERVDGLEASFLGRDRELRQVKDVFNEVLDAGRARLVSVVGAAGVGKSRLRWEMYKYGDGIATQFLYHAGRCLPYGDGVAYWALAEMVRARLGIAEEESSETVSHKLEEGLRRWVTDDADREFLQPRLGVLLGVADPGLGREELFAGWRLWFERLADQQPVMLVVEDLQWADNGLLDFFDELLEWSAEQPIFVLTLARPELLERRPTWGSGRRNAVTVMLDPLTADVMGGLLDELVPGLPPDARERIVAQADGIPLYAVELVRSLIDRDLVQPIDGVYRLVGAVEAIEVPASLTSLVAARIDALPADERALVQGLAVLGGTFPRAAATAATELPPDTVDAMLADLVRREILRVRTDRLSPDRGQYAFTQGLLRQVAYDTLSRRDRKGRHLAVAAHLRATFPDDGAEVAEVVAQHYLDAFQAMPEDPDAAQVKAQAAAAFVRAGQRALAVGAPETAERAYNTAAELTEDAAARTTLMEQAGEAALRASRYETALDRFEAAAATHAATGQEREAARLAVRIGVTLGRMYRIDEAIARIRPALAVLSQGEPDAAVADAHNGLASSLLFGGHRKEAAAHIDAALELGEALELPEVLANAAVRRGQLLGFANRSQEALVAFEWGVALAEKHGLGRPAMSAHGNAGDICLQSDLPGAAEHLTGMIDLARRHGFRYGETIGVTNLTLLYLLTGQWDDAERICRELLSGERRADDEFVYQRLAILHALHGQADLAEAELAEMAPWADSEDLQSRATYAAGAVIVAVLSGDTERALAVAEPAVHYTAESLGLRHDAFRLLWPDGLEAALVVGRLDAAQRLLDVVTSRPIGHVAPYLRAQRDRYQARLAAAIGDHDRVGAGYDSAERTLRQLGYPYWLAATQLDHADWLVGQGRPTEAAPLLADAANTFEQLSAEPALSRARELWLSLPMESPAGTAQEVPAQRG